jgi:sugar phosphate isomerase/epimerase
MSQPLPPFSVFTKPWRDKPLAELGAFVRSLGFDGIELPVRTGYQAPPERVAGGSCAQPLGGAFGALGSSPAQP